MADRNRRYSLAAIALPFLFVIIAGLARANEIFVNTTDGESPMAPACSLPDAVMAHNSMAGLNGCAAGSANDTIVIGVTGTITIDEPLEITQGILIISGPTTGGPA